MLRVGRIEYANCTPLFAALDQLLDRSNFSFVSGVPARLNRLLYDGEIDVCPASSIEFASHPHRYKILPDISISSVAAVASVLLFSKSLITDLDGHKILLSSESATSVNLLKILMAKCFKSRCSYALTSSHSDLASQENQALLLIGDAALRAASTVSADMHVYDLGQLWHDWTGLPFVYALWLCRRELSRDNELLAFARQLLLAKEMVAESMESILTGAKELEWMGRERLLTYWRDNIDYQLDEKAQSGLCRYYEECFDAGLIAAVPKLDFI